MRLCSLFVVWFVLIAGCFPAFGKDSIPHDKLRIITELTPPSAMLRPDGSLEGFGVEIVEAVQQELGLDISIEVMPWARGYKFLRESSNVLLFSTTRTSEREKLFHWVGPIARLDWIFYGHKDNDYDINSLDDAKKVSGIGVYRGDVRTQFLLKAGFKNLQIVGDQNTNFKKLIKGRLALVASSNIGVKDFILKDKQLRRIIIPVYTFKRAELYLAFSKGTDPRIVKSWDAAFKKLDQRGVIRKIQNRWY